MQIENRLKEQSEFSPRSPRAERAKCMQKSSFNITFYLILLFVIEFTLSFYFVLHY